MTDKRKRRWIVLDIDYPNGNTLQKLITKLDSTAPGVWVALLTAAKRHNPQGHFSWTTNHEAWNTIGLKETDFNYTWDVFIRCLGDLKLTRKTSRGRVQQVQIRGWEDWQQIPRTGGGRNYTSIGKPNSGGPNPAWDEQQQRLANRAKPAPKALPERERERESEREKDLLTITDPETHPITPPPPLTELLKALTQNTSIESIE